MSDSSANENGGGVREGGVRRRRVRRLVPARLRKREETRNGTPLCLLVFARPRGKSIQPMGQQCSVLPHCGRPRWLLWLPVGSYSRLVSCLPSLRGCKRGTRGRSQIFPNPRPVSDVPLSCPGIYVLPGFLLKSGIRPFATFKID